MCGLVGIFNPAGNSATSVDIVALMRDAMIHRGPDGSGIWQDKKQKCCLGHRRLSIIDLSDSAAQPMTNQGGTVVIVFNGEIYNHAEIRNNLKATGKYTWKTDHSDTEVLLHAYEEWGIDCVKKFYGMFAFAIYDNRNSDNPLLYLARDRIGIKPLYFTRTGKGEWIFASEIKAILKHPDVTPKMEPAAFWHYLTFIVTPAPLTLYKNIFKLPAGHIISINHNGKASAEQYWDCNPIDMELFNKNDLSEDEAEYELLRLLRLSIKRRMVSDVPFGVLLSGGVDSGMNVALMSELMDRPVTTFTIGYENEDKTNEFNWARKVSKKYKTEHHEMWISKNDAQDFLPLLVQIQDEPIADNVCIPLYFLAKLVKNSGTTVVQVGEGADENLLGYWWIEHYRKKQLDIYDPARYPKNQAWWSRFLKMKRGINILSGEDSEIKYRADNKQELFWGGAVCWWGELRTKLTPDPAPFKNAINCPVAGLLPEGFDQPDSHNVVRYYLEKFDGKLESPDVLRKIPYMEMKLRLPEHLLMRVDKLTMAHSIEARVPFLDHDLVEFITKLPPSYKLKNGVGKCILKKVAESYLDNDMIYRKKQGFGAPMDAWLREADFSKKMQDVFNRSDLVKEGFINKDYFNGMLKQQRDYGGGYGFHIWTVMNAALWYESYINRNTNIF